MNLKQFLDSKRREHLESEIRQWKRALGRLKTVKTFRDDAHRNQVELRIKFLQGTIDAYEAWIEWKLPST